MSASVAAKRYAEALFQLGQEQSTSDQWVDELVLVCNVFQENKDLYTYLMHPRVQHQQKNQLIDEAFKGLHINVIHTIKLLIKRGRVEIMPSITKHYIQMVNDSQGIAEGTVYSVRKLSNEETQVLAETFAKRLNKQAINFTNEIDESLLGGLKIQIGNTVYDGSIRRKLDRLEQNIMTANK